MVASDDGAEEIGWGGSLRVHNWHVSIERTTVHGFGALLSIELGSRVATRRAASHCALRSRVTRCHSTCFGTPAWLAWYPIA